MNPESQRTSLARKSTTTFFNPKNEHKLKHKKLIEARGKEYFTVDALFVDAKISIT